MTVNAKSAQGVVTISWNGSTVAEVKKIGEPKKTVDMKDVTPINETNGYSQSLPTLKKGEEFTLEGNFYPSDAAQVAMEADFESQMEREYIITSTNPVWTLTGNGYISAFGLTGLETSGVQGFTASIHPTSKPTLAVTASTGLTTPFFSISESAVIVPAAAQATYTYVATVLTGIASVTITPTASAGVIKVNGSTVTTGQASSAITLGAAGSVTAATITVTETGKTTKTYTIYITRAAS